MTFYDLLYALVSVLIIGQSLLVISLLVLRVDQNGIYKSLIVLFSANIVTQIPSISDVLFSLGYIKLYALNLEVLSIPANLLLAPSLWFYVRGLTSESELTIDKKDLLHFVPFLISVVLCTILLTTPVSVRSTIIGNADGPHTLLTNILTGALIGVMLTWSLQLVVYLTAILRRIIRYRGRLKDLFASTEGRELQWVVWFIVILSLSMLIFIPDLIFGFPVELTFIPLTLDVVLFWFLAVWGLRQMPAFNLEDETRLRSQSKSFNSSIGRTEKYEKSALTDRDMHRISQKIQNSMSEDKLFLDSNLSLRVLSDHIRVQSNYVSQTLNAYIGESFFDFVNRCRIEYAKPLLESSKDTVDNIAFDAGFNSRSSFYKAFKRETGLTPTAYKKVERN